VLDTIRDAIRLHIDDRIESERRSPRPGLST
jgi:hypothetical protein